MTLQYRAETSNKHLELLTIFTGVRHAERSGSRTALNISDSAGERATPDGYLQPLGALLPQHLVIGWWLLLSGFEKQKQFVRILFGCADYQISPGNQNKIFVSFSLSSIHIFLL